MKNNNNAPMAAAAMKYDKNGKPLWGEMWDTFCGLAAEGGPPHRGKPDKISFNPNYKISSQSKFNAAATEVIHGLNALKANNVKVTNDGEIVIDLGNKTKAKWFAYTISLENVEARNRENYLILPFNENFSIEKEIKSIMTVWGKAMHYWKNHRNISIRLFILLFKYDPIIKKTLQ